MKRVTVLGGGSWGTTLALVLHDNGHQVVKRFDQAFTFQDIHNCRSSRSLHTEDTHQWPNYLY